MSNSPLLPPVFVFPPPGPFIWPDPRSSLLPKPKNYPYSDQHWYIETALQKPDNRPISGFGSLDPFVNSTRAVRTWDVIEPRWTPPDADSIFWVNQLTLHCLVCDISNVPDGQGYLWLACNTFTKNIFDHIHGRRPGPPGESSRMTVHPTYNEDSFPRDPVQKRALACAFFLELGNDLQTNVMSRLFMVQNTPRNASLSISQGQYIYNDTSLGGTYLWPRQASDTIPPGYPTPTPIRMPTIPTIHACVSSRGGNCSDDGWSHWPIGKRVGVIIGGIAGLVFVVLLLRLISFKSGFAYGGNPNRQKPMLLSELREQQRLDEERRREEEGRAAGPTPRQDEDLPNRNAGSARTGVAEGEEQENKAPPAYHEIVTDQRVDAPATMSPPPAAGISGYPSVPVTQSPAPDLDLPPRYIAPSSSPTPAR